jgi:hypothetical protein
MIGPWGLKGQKYYHRLLDESPTDFFGLSASKVEVACQALITHKDFGIMQAVASVFAIRPTEPGTQDHYFCRIRPTLARCLRYGDTSHPCFGVYPRPRFGVAAECDCSFGVFKEGEGVTTRVYNASAEVCRRLCVSEWLHHWIWPCLANWTGCTIRERSVHNPDGLRRGEAVLIIANEISDLPLSTDFGSAPANTAVIYGLSDDFRRLVCAALMAAGIAVPVKLGQWQSADYVLSETYRVLLVEKNRERLAESVSVNAKAICRVGWDSLSWCLPRFYPFQFRGARVKTA